MYDSYKIKQFYEMVDSLKKSRRANLTDISSDENIIEKLYIDPLENDLVFETCRKKNTTILIGRKGTGKSTIIARLQHEIRKSKDIISLYIDVKTVYEQSKTFSFDTSEYQGIMDEQDLETYLISKAFLTSVIDEVKKEVRKNTIQYQWDRFTNALRINKKSFEERLNELFKEIEEFKSNDITLLKQKKLLQNNEQAKNVTTTKSAELDGTYNTSPSVSTKMAYKKSSNYLENNKLQSEFSEVLLRYFNVKEIMNRLKEVLSKIGIKTVFICLDDFSEIEQRPMEIFVDTIVAPLNNWSEEFFKFKISAYPGRLYLGDIDPTKVDQIKLDYYDLYKSVRVNETELAASNNVERLLERRSQYFCDCSFTDFIDSKLDPKDFYSLLFKITSNVPRNIGWILWYTHKKTIALGKGMNFKDLELAAENYYTDCIETFFTKNSYMRQSFKEKLSKYHLENLLRSFIKEARKNKSEIMASNAKVWGSSKPNPPSSHFFVDKSKFEDLLLTLELNYFISKYNEQKDQESTTIMSFYSLNYGLCVKESINYGRGNDRKYLIQRRFNYNELIGIFLESAKSIECDNPICTASFKIEQLEILKVYDMLCPSCKIGTCHVRDIEVQIEEAPESILLLPIEYEVVNSLKILPNQYPAQLALELDCTVQKIRRVVDKLEERDLVKREKDKNANDRTIYVLTDTAEIYF